MFTIVTTTTATISILGRRGREDVGRASVPAHLSAHNRCGNSWIPFGEHPLELERYREY